MRGVALLLVGLLALGEPGPSEAAPHASSGGATAERKPVWYLDELPRARPAAAPQRIVSLAPVVTETLFALGAGPRVVGVTRYCDRPEAARALPQVGGFVDPQLERVLSLRPDLVVAMPSMGQRTLLDRLRERGVPVLVVFGDTLDEVRELVLALADAVGDVGAGRGLVKQLDAELRSVAQRGLPRPTRAAVVVGVRPLVLAGHGTFADDALRLVGATPVAPADGPSWPTLSVEGLLSLRPDVLVAAEGPDAASALSRLLAPLGPRAPRVVAGPQAILMRPGPALAADVATLRQLLVDGAPRGAPTP